MERPMKIFTGQANPELALAICDSIGIPLGKSMSRHFSNDNIEVQFKESLREADVFILQSLAGNGTFNVSDSVMELLLMIDAARGASAARITAVIPYFSYARSDKKDSPRISIAARLVADLLETAGADRVLTMTLHSPQVHGFFRIPTDHLSAEPVIANHFITHLSNLEDAVVLAPDAGDIKRASSLAERLGAGIAFTSLAVTVCTWAQPSSASRGWTSSSASAPIRATSVQKKWPPATNSKCSRSRRFLPKRSRASTLARASPRCSTLRVCQLSFSLSKIIVLAVNSLCHVKIARSAFY